MKSKPIIQFQYWCAPFFARRKWTHVKISTVFLIVMFVSTGSMALSRFGTSIAQPFQPQVLTSAACLSDTSKLDIQDSIKAVASHIPAVERYNGSGKIFYTDQYEYTNNCHEKTLKWINDYPSEAAAFYKVVSTFLESTDVSGLSSTQFAIYQDIRAQWLMVHYPK